MSSSDPSTSLQAPPFQDDLEHLCRQARRMFVRLLQVSDIRPAPGLAPTRDTCLYASTMLAEMLHRFGGCRTTIRGGDGKLDGGYVHEQGERFGHFWVEVVSADGQAFVCDIAADQFGADPVVVLPLEASQARYVCGNQAEVSRQADGLMAEVLATQRKGLRGLSL